MRSFAALVGVERETVRAPRRSIMVVALEKRRQSKYDGLVDRLMTELFITGATRCDRESFPYVGPDCAVGTYAVRAGKMGCAGS